MQRWQSRSRRRSSRSSPTRRRGRQHNAMSKRERKSIVRASGEIGKRGRVAGLRYDGGGGADEAELFACEGGRGDQGGEAVDGG